MCIRFVFHLRLLTRQYPLMPLYVYVRLPDGTCVRDQGIIPSVLFSPFSSIYMNFDAKQ